MLKSAFCARLCASRHSRKCPQWSHRCWKCACSRTHFFVAICHSHLFVIFCIRRYCIYSLRVGVPLWLGRRAVLRNGLAAWLAAWLASWSAARLATLVAAWLVVGSLAGTLVGGMVGGLVARLVGNKVSNMVGGTLVWLVLAVCGRWCVVGGRRRWSVVGSLRRLAVCGLRLAVGGSVFRHQHQHTPKYCIHSVLEAAAKPAYDYR